jgi:hypothetical protein
MITENMQVSGISMSNQVSQHPILSNLDLLRTSNPHQLHQKHYQDEES